MLYAKPNWLPTTGRWFGVLWQGIKLSNDEMGRKKWDCLDSSCRLVSVVSAPVTSFFVSIWPSFSMGGCSSHQSLRFYPSQFYLLVILMLPFQFLFFSCSGLSFCFNSHYCYWQLGRIFNKKLLFWFSWTKAIYRVALKLLIIYFDL